jgi:hypothetical protein
MAKGIFVKAAWNGHVSPKRVPQELLVEALDSRQYG